MQKKQNRNKMFASRSSGWCATSLVLTAVVLASCEAQTTEQQPSEQHKTSQAQAFQVGLAQATPYDWSQFNGNAQHSGNNTKETVITPGNVGGLQRLFHASLPSVADGAPALLSGVATVAGTTDLLFVTTKDGHIVALNAHTGATVWSKQNGPGACHINNGSSTCYTTSSPAIDPSRTYVYSYGLDGKAHKYAVSDGSEATSGGWPELVTTKPFDEKGSSALSVATVQNGVSYLYVSNGGYPGDNGDYQGHVTAINLNDGSQHVFNTVCSDQAVHFLETPGAPDCNQRQTAVWARSGVVYDSDTNEIYIGTGNGLFDPANHHWGDSVLALHPDGTGANGNPLDSYTPTDYQQLQNNDADIGSTAPAILPVPSSSNVKHLAVQSGKDARLRLINLDNLSGQGGPGHTGGEVGTVINVPQGGEVLTAPAVWVNPSDGSTWVFVANDSGLSGLKLVIDSSGNPSLSKQWQNSNGGASPLIANGVLFYAGSNNIRALDPVTGNQLWHDTQIGNIHWQSPVVANGILYITDGSNSLTAYALMKFAAKVNFQLSTTVTPAGYLPDSGAAYGARGGGWSYGWNIDNSATARERNAPNSPDKRYDTLNHLQKPSNPNAVWDLAVPNGTYSVHLVAGDPNYIDSVFKINVEGVLTVNGTPNASTHWIEGTSTVTVTDGTLTVSNAPGASNNKVCFIEITQQ